MLSNWEYIIFSMYFEIAGSRDIGLMFIHFIDRYYFGNLKFIGKIPLSVFDEL